MTTARTTTATGGAPPHPATLLPRLVSDDAPAAIDFYRQALGAELVERHDGEDGKVHHAVLAVAGMAFAVKSADAADPSPATLGGTPVVLLLELEHAEQVDRWGTRFEAAGGHVVFAVGDQEYGRRDGRFRDPSGHLWQLPAPR